MRSEAAAEKKTDYLQADENKERTPRQFIAFSFYKLDPMWHRLPESEKQQGREEFIGTVREFSNSGTVIVPYSCVGMRADTDLLLWRIDYQLERLQGMSTQMTQSGLGRF